jgi:hypothetical protein
MMMGKYLTFTGFSAAMSTYLLLFFLMDHLPFPLEICIELLDEIAVEGPRIDRQQSRH